MTPDCICDGYNDLLQSSRQLGTSFFPGLAVELTMSARIFPIQALCLEYAVSGAMVLSVLQSQPGQFPNHSKPKKICIGVRLGKFWGRSRINHRFKHRYPEGYERQAQLYSGHEYKSWLF
jgi:hypothetical protein